MSPIRKDLSSVSSNLASVPDRGSTPPTHSKEQWNSQRTGLMFNQVMGKLNSQGKARKNHEERSQALQRQTPIDNNRSSATPSPIQGSSFRAASPVMRNEDRSPGSGRTTPIERNLFSPATARLATPAGASTPPMHPQTQWNAQVTSRLFKQTMGHLPSQKNALKEKEAGARLISSSPASNVSTRPPSPAMPTPLPPFSPLESPQRAPSHPRASPGPEGFSLPPQAQGARPASFTPLGSPLVSPQPQVQGAATPPILQLAGERLSSQELKEKEALDSDEEAPKPELLQVEEIQDILFSQDSIKGTTSDGSSLKELQSLFTQGSKKSEEVEPIRVVRIKGDEGTYYVSRDNRRLYACQTAIRAGKTATIWARIYPSSAPMEDPHADNCYQETLAKVLPSTARRLKIPAHLLSEGTSSMETMGIKVMKLVLSQRTYNHQERSAEERAFYGFEYGEVRVRGPAP